MKVAIIGAGPDADCHVRFSRMYKGARLVGIADSEVALAEDSAHNLEIPRAYSSATSLLSDTKPHVVHIVTSSQTHRSVVTEVLDAGCHVIVEKPLGMNLREARALYDLAETRGVLLCPMHHFRFEPTMRRADSLIRSGELGRVVNVESYYGLDSRGPAFRDYPQPNVLPALYRVPGGVYQEFLPHPLSLLLQYTGAPHALSVMHRSNGALPRNLPDEIRILVDGERAMGTVTLSFAAQPHLHFVRVYGTRGMLDVSISTATMTQHGISSLPQAATRVTDNFRESLQKTRSTLTSAFQLLTGNHRPHLGRLTLIHEFYDQIAQRGAPPVSREDALAIIEMTGGVLDQLKCEPLASENLVPVRSVQPTRGKVLVTGGTGFVGKALVTRLVADGYDVRVLARKLSNVNALLELGAEISWGDVADIESFDAAVSGRDVVIHLAAGTSGSAKDSQSATLGGTRNLLELAHRHRLKRLVYISSCSVYGVADYKRNAVVSENAALERFPERRGSYSASKRAAETYVVDWMKSGTVPTVILRPGTICGPGGDLYTPIMGFSVGSLYIVIGMGGFVLPFVYVENLADAIVRAIEKDQAIGHVFNVVDPERLTKRAYMNSVIRRANRTARVVYFPYWMLYSLTWLQERAFSLMKRRPVLTCYRLTSSQRKVFYDSEAARRSLGWTPVVPLSKAMDQLVASELSKKSVAHVPTTVARNPIRPDGQEHLPTAPKTAH